MNGPADDGMEHMESGTGTRSAELTRREWLLCLGQAAIVMGFASKLIESETASSWTAALDPAVLPSGLYEPSNDHLRDALSSDGEYHPIPPGSEIDYLRPRTGPFQPQFLSPAEFETLRRVVELMLGQGNKPSNPSSSEREGAMKIAQTVAEWIELRVASAPAVRVAARRLASDHRAVAVACHGADAVAELEAHEPERTCRLGLHWLEQESQHRYQRSFTGLPELRQIDLLKLISDDRPEKGVENDSKRFFALVKAEVIRGYYTSQAGLQELDFKGDAFYAVSPGCSGGS